MAFQPAQSVSFEVNVFKLNSQNNLYFLLISECPIWKGKFLRRLFCYILLGTWICLFSPYSTCLLTYLFHCCIHVRFFVFAGIFIPRCPNSTSRLSTRRHFRKARHRKHLHDVIRSNLGERVPENRETLKVEARCR